MHTKDELFKIISSYRKITTFHKYCNRIMDRFGYWNNKQLYPIPTNTDSTLVEYSLLRAKSLNNMNLLWSGGIDSTFMVCCFIYSKTPVNIICDKRSIRDEIGRASCRERV